MNGQPHDAAPPIVISKSRVMRLMVAAVVVLHLLNVPAVAFTYAWPAH